MLILDSKLSTIMLMKKIFKTIASPTFPPYAPIYLINVNWSVHEEILIS